MASTNFCKYLVTEKDGRVVTFVVGPRLDMFFLEKFDLLSKHNFTNSGGYAFDAVLSVTDRLVKTNSEFRRSAWVPWIEAKYPTEEVVFGSLMTLRHWVEDLKLSNIYIHCDAGSHRSPTIMGFYMNSFVDHIDSFIVEPMFKEEVAAEEKKYFSNALEYASSYLDRPFGDNYKVLLSAIAENFYGKNLFLEDMISGLKLWENGFPTKKQ